jgi:hypothetical protein
MSATFSDPAVPRSDGISILWRRQLDRYPDNGPRIGYLAITVLATITLYYESYVGGSVSTLLLSNLKMSFTFYVVILAFGNLIGAFGSLFAGLSDRLGRANLVVGGLSSPPSSPRSSCRPPPVSGPSASRASRSAWSRASAWSPLPP